LTIASFVWDKVVKTGRRFQNIIKKIYGQCFSSRLKTESCQWVAEWQICRICEGITAKDDSECAFLNGTREALTSSGKRCNFCIIGRRKRVPLIVL